MSYNPWPLGQLPLAYRRREPEQVKALGFEWEDPRDLIDIFEKKVAAFAGSKFAVATDCCTHAMELSLRYLIEIGEIKDYTVKIPKNTYISLPQMLRRLGFNIEFLSFVWTGCYYILGTRVIDGAVRWRPNMYIPGSLQCLSFQIKKRIPIGRGGMILCDSEEEYNWLKLASYDGRDLNLPYDHPDHVKMDGFHYYMEPESAARGLILMSSILPGEDTGNSTNYPDVSKMIKL